MRRIKCIIAYDGTNFAGYQIQQNKRTVQGELERALAIIHKGEAVRVYASGRTDATVHAYGQVIHFDSPLTIPEERWAKALNALLPDDIVVKEAAEVSPSFHARFSAKAKEYRYRVRTAQEPDVFLRNYVYHYPYSLNHEAIQKALTFLIGTHDFTSFCSAKTDVEDKVRTIYEANMIVEKDEVVFQLIGNGFLYNMVRIIAGTMLEVGIGKIKAEDIPHILEKKDRSLAGKTAPGHGLYLWKVYYDN
ncbi:tRNA pseudouridine(38-40) synthase TruA [Thermolongibacillus altinsuensis]|uniref:tRNA pseudouridine(38-40) synthase TruA n=1 Tax=Thermolongibacillus altinsuensis TaxID=575256 RepID=UPI00242A2E99|nr:tRNA pseudouridine(38-40) synthase TruA [Thermolongibacillus altinsuensis]GMB10032.1 tRNA pseudouridine synthase A 1 [Thermolongibacillus altinsuensis]